MDINQKKQEAIHQTLQEYFGFDRFRLSQEKIILHVLEKKDSLVIMPTGGGKSLCYQLPALIMEGITLVVSPLISLMKDQVESLNSNHIPAAFLNSSLSPEEKRKIYDQLNYNQLKLLYIAPERLNQPNFLQFLKQKKIDLVAVDEAHCISQWGHDFRPDYQRLGVIKENFPSTPIIALTATANPAVEQDIVQRLHLQTPMVEKASFYRPNLILRVTPKYQAKEKLLNYLKMDKKLPTIVYCFSRKEAEDIAAYLNSYQIRSLPYHAGLSTYEREVNQNAFIKDDIYVITATIAFGMGIDKPNIRRIVHFSMPKSVESYYQEIGRGGRDGLPCECLFFYTFADRKKHEYFLKELEEKRAEEERGKLEKVDAYASLFSCRWKFLQNWFQSKQLVENCGHCDNCKQATGFFDATIIAQKILSAVYRTGQSHSSFYLVDVLQGKLTRNIAEKDHQNLSVFGIAKEFNQMDLLNFIQQLEESFLIQRNPLFSFGLMLTEQGKQWLKAKKSILFRKPSKQNQEDKKRLNIGSLLRKKVETADGELFETLQLLRKKIAKDHDIHPHHVLPDNALMEISKKVPQSMKALTQITGISKSKAEDFGNDFLQVIQNHKRKKQILTVK